MSTLSELLGDVWALLFPPRCPVCGRMMTAGERTVCTHCRAAAPLTGFWREADNPLFRRFWGLLPVERASGFIYYRRGSGWRELIRSFKYRSAWRLAYEMGRWYGRCLRESGLYDDVEVVVPLPLHPFKRMRRGYNQSEYIAEGIARELGVGVDRRSVIRCRNTASQARRPAANATRMSATPLPSAVPRRWPAATCCWSTTSSRRAIRSSRAAGRFCRRCPTAA